MNEKKTLSKKPYNYVIAAFIILSIIFATITVCILSQRFQTTTLDRNPKFVIASWDYPDEYGQGIYGFQFFDNNSEDTPIPFYNDIGEFYFLHSYTDYYDPINVTPGIKLKILVTMLLNSTLTGAVDVNDGKNYLRNSNVVSSNDELNIFSQQNFTYQSGEPVITDETMFYYTYYVILDFDFAEFTIYYVTVNYEIYQEFSEEEYRHECSDTSGIEYQGNYYLGENDYGIDSNGSVVEFWIAPDDSNSEGVLYKLNFTNIDNTDGTLNIAARYRVEGATNFFRYRIVYDDASYNDSALGTSTDWATLNIVPETGKVLDYFLLYNFDTPPNTNSGNLSVWIDYIVITNDFSDWIEATEAILIFEVPMSEATAWALNSWYILLGIGLVVFSGVYLVKGGRSEFNSSKVFFAIVMFMIGWALIVGTIAP